MALDVPGTEGLPLLGHLPQIMREPTRFLAQNARVFGPVSKFRMGRERLVFINDARFIDQLLRDREAYRSSATRIGLRSFLGDGLFSLEGDTHRRHRRLLQPAFHRERIRGYAETMLRESCRAIDGFSAQGTLDLRKAMVAVTFAIVTQCLFGTDAASAAPEIDRAMRRIAPTVTFQAQLGRALGFPRSPIYGPAARASIRYLGELTQSLVQKRRARGLEDDLLSLLIAARDEDGSALSDADVASEALTLLLAGHETTAHTLSWAHALLAGHPAVRARLAREVDDVAGGRPLVYADLDKLKFSECVVKEALRMYPAAWWGDRVLARDTVFGDTRVPQGTTVVFSVFVTQRDPRYFSAPNEFDPDRFGPERAAAIPDGAFLPFGGGRHVCIGNAFAMLEAKIVLATLSQRTRVVPTAPISMTKRHNITLEMAHPFLVRFERRASSAFVVEHAGT